MTDTGIQTLHHANKKWANYKLLSSAHHLNLEAREGCRSWLHSLGRSRDWRDWWDGTGVKWREWNEFHTVCQCGTSLGSVAWREMNSNSWNYPHSLWFTVRVRIQPRWNIFSCLTADREAGEGDETADRGDSGGDWGEGEVEGWRVSRLGCVYLKQWLDFYQIEISSLANKPLSPATYSGIIVKTLK